MNHKKLLAVFMLVSIVVCQHRFSGFVNFSNASRLNDASLIRLPYRIAGTTWDYTADNFSIYGDFAMEYYLRSDLDFMSDRNTQEISWDLRELFFQFYRGNTEFRIGKQIHSWGMVDENSPLDVVSAFDYYYLFNSGAERKLGSWSLSTETYFSDFVIKTVFSPFHQTNRLPVIDGAPDPEFGFSLPGIPSKNQFINHKNPIEYGISIKKSFIKSELSFIYFAGVDRLFNFSGINYHGPADATSWPPGGIDLVFGYRKSHVLGIGNTMFIDDITIRTDLGYFSTMDINDDIKRSHPVFTNIYDSIFFSIPFKEISNYYQGSIQIEYTLPYDINFISQFFEFNLLDYNSDYHILLDTLPNLPFNITWGKVDPADFDPEKSFTPGLGSPLAALSKKGIMLNLEKSFLDNRLSVRTGGLFDIDNESEISGTMIAVSIDYEIDENLEIKVGLTQINGSNDHPDGEHYRFNEMEDFSNFRMQLEFRF